MSDIFNFSPSDDAAQAASSSDPESFQEPSDDMGFTPDAPRVAPPNPTKPPTQGSVVTSLANLMFSVVGVVTMFFGRLRLLRLLIWTLIAIGITLVAAGFYFPFWLKQIMSAVRSKGDPLESGGPDELDTLLGGTTRSPEPKDNWWRDMVRRAPLITKAKLKAMLDAHGATIRPTLAAVKKDLLPFDDRLKTPFLLITMYSETRGRSWEVGKAGERGFWQIWKPYFNVWLAKQRVAVDEFARSPKLQASLMNSYLADPGQFRANWNRALTAQPKSVILKAVGTIFPRIPAAFDVMTACVVWKNGVDPSNKFSTAERFLDAMVRAASILALATGFEDEAAIGHAASDTPINNISVAQADAEIANAATKVA